MRGDAAPFDATARHHSLTVLTRLAVQRRERRGWLEPALLRRIEDLAEVALEVARETGGPLGRVLARVISLRGSVTLAETLMEQLDNIEYRHSVHLREIALVCAYKALAAKGPDHPARKPKERAEIGTVKRNLAVWLADLGQRKRALAITREAVTIFRDLVQNDESFRVDLAITLNNQGIQLSAVGRWEESSQALMEALRLYEQGEGEEYLAALAADNLGSVLERLGRDDRAFELTQEAARRMQLWEEEIPVLSRGAVGRMLTNLGVRLRNQGDQEEARQVFLKARHLYERLSEARPDLFLPDLAWNLKNLSAVVYELGQPEEAIRIAQSAIDLTSQLRREHPSALRSVVAGTHHNLAAFLWTSDRKEEALLHLQEAIRERRQLAKVDFLAFGLPLVDSLQNLSTLLFRLSRVEDGLTPAGECVTLLRQLAEESPAVFLPHLGRLLRDLVFCLRQAGRPEEAVAYLRQAIDIYRSLVQTGDNQFGLELARSVNELGIFLGQKGSYAAAAEAVPESVEIYRALARENSEIESELAITLQNLAVWNMAAGHHEEALKCAPEVLDILLRHPSLLSKDAAAQIVETVELQVKILRSLHRATEARRLCTSILRRLPTGSPDGDKPLAEVRRGLLRIRRAASQDSMTG